MLTSALMMGGVAASLCGVAGAKFVGPKLLASMAMPEPDFKLGDSLAFDSVLDDGMTITSKAGHYYRVIEISGIDDTTLSSSAKETNRVKRHRALKYITAGTPPSRLKIFHIRDKVHYAFDAEFQEEEYLLKEMHEKTLKHFEHCYRNRIFLVLEQQVSKRPLKRTKLKPCLATLEAHTKDLLSALKDFNPVALRFKSKQNKKISPLLSFWATLVNLNTMKLPPGDTAVRGLNEQLALSDISYERAKQDGTVVVQNEHGKTFHRFMTINAWEDGATSSEQILNQILSLPYELVVFSDFIGMDKGVGMFYLDYQKKQATMAFGGNSLREDYEDAIDVVDEGKTLACTFQVTVHYQAKDVATLDVIEDKVRAIFYDFSIKPVVEKRSAEYVYHLRLPGVHSKRVLNRGSTFLSHNAAHFCSFRGSAEGLIASDWGPGPIALLKTINQGAYFYTHHVSEAKEANALVVMVGVPGSGKTMLAQFLIYQGFRFPEYKAVLFDRHNGLRIGVEMNGGDYNDRNESFYLSPFLCEPTKRNLSFLQGFLLMLAGLEKVDDKGDVVHDAQDIRAADKALNIIFNHIPPEGRLLSRMFKDGVFDSGPLKDGLEKWAIGSQADLFNGQKEVDGKLVAYDSLNFDKRVTAFELGDMLDNAQEATPVIKYIIHRLKEKLGETGQPHLVFFDETKAMLTHPLMAAHIQKTCNEIRKLRGVPVLAFQSLNGVADTDEGDTILKNATRMFLFKDEGGSETFLRERLKLNDQEVSFVLGRDNASVYSEHPVLLKTGSKETGSRILDIDLSYLGKHLRVFASGKEKVLQMKRYQQQSSSTWKSQFLNQEEE